MSSFEETKTPKNTIFTTPNWPSSRRSNSLSSSSSNSSSFISFSNEEDSPPLSPTHQRIPFSWETIPGIPKNQIIKRLESSRKSSCLPLPPAALSVSCNSTKPNCKKHHIVSSNNDPFFAALVECSNRDHEEDEDEDEDEDIFGSISKGSTKSSSNRLGFLNFSCKNNCSVYESLVVLPKEKPKSISYKTPTTRRNSM